MASEEETEAGEETGEETEVGEESETAEESETGEERAEEEEEAEPESAGDLFERVTGLTELTEEQTESEDRFRGEETESRPTTEVTCPRCGNDTAYWHLEQTRSADESETRFFECTECGYRWREYD